MLVPVGVATLVLIVSGCFLFTCQSPGISPPTISVDGRIVRATGQTDMPDGARMDFSAVGGLYVSSPTSGTSTVSHGRSRAIMEFDDWASGQYLYGGRIANKPDSAEEEGLGTALFTLG